MFPFSHRFILLAGLLLPPGFAPAQRFSPLQPRSSRLALPPDVQQALSSHLADDRTATLPQHLEPLVIPQKEPLYILKGLRMPATFNPKELPSRSITKLRFMKSSRARRRYGTSGQNGVIFIKTKPWARQR